MGGTREENREPGAGSREAPQFGRVFVGVSSMWSVSKAKKRDSTIIIFDVSELDCRLDCCHLTML